MTEFENLKRIVAGTQVGSAREKTAVLFAIDKQIGKRPGETTPIGNRRSFICPACSMQAYIEHDFCPFCGQRLAWEGEDVD